MALHRQVEQQDDEFEINPVYVRELHFSVPRHRLAQHGLLPDTALQAVQGRADAGRQRPAEPRHVRDHLDGAAGASS